YSPGSLNFAVALPKPEYGSFTPPPFSFSSVGRAFSKVTVPGPRYFAQSSVTGGREPRIGALELFVYFASSSAHTDNSSGAATDALRTAALASVLKGPWTDGPLSARRIIGGVLATDESFRGLMLYSGINRKGMAFV